ncbi:hypothetical protein C8A01DRAFT_43933 [Parachaetomium inaequale]|uniref:Uncharacterized protein n=1 Tax=Parachaetomium inaequale TaxID=2588326 RepID=A0AAN6PLJ1_9PEZI|nr:hypothetical protein C8A01DRAFT_43933 [Parachaetomium inaequale]
MSNSSGENPKDTSAWEREVKNALPYVKPDSLSISDLPSTKSASQLTFAHFLCLKVLWKSHSAKKFVLNKYVDQPSIERAEQRTRTPKCKAFFDNIGRKEYPEESIFSMVHLYMDLVFKLDSDTDFYSLKVLLTPQPLRVEGRGERTPESPLVAKGSPSRMEVDSPEMSDTDHDMLDPSDLAEAFPAQVRLDQTLPAPTAFSPSASSLSSDPSTEPGASSPAHPSEFTPSEDEILVNMALLLLLNSLTELDETLRSKRYRWVPNRELVRILKSHTEHNLSAALVEVKPCVRLKKQKQIEWQEGAQMAAYIYKLLSLEPPPTQEFGLLRCDKPGVKRRLLVSQDHAEIYITIAEYDSTYERFLGLHHPPDPKKAPTLQLRGKDGKAVAKGSSSTDFLTMNCYGPWRIDTSSELKQVCEALVALSFYLAK